MLWALAGAPTMAAAGLGLSVGGERRGRSERWIKERGPGLIGEELTAWPARPVFVSDGGPSR